MSLYRILCTTSPAWLVGEDEKDAIPRRLLRDTSLPGETYPGDPAGKIISVIPYKKTYHAKDLAATIRREVILDLSDADLARARSGEYKVPPETSALADVTFEDKYGATAVDLLRFDATATVTKEDDERAEIDAVREANDWTRLVYEGELKTWANDYSIAFTLGDLLPAKPVAPVCETLPEPVFAIEATRLKQKLAKTIVHSGAGLYEVKAGEYATIQSALDQLWIDQGAAAFTASQYIRIFADQSPYDENVIPNASLNPDETLARTLIIEGDPGDNRANIVVGATGGSRVFYPNMDHCVIRHMTITEIGANQAIQAGSGSLALSVSDCVLSCAYSGINTSNSAVVEDCVITTVHPVFDAVTAVTTTGSVIVRRCKITGPGKATSTAAAIIAVKGSIVVEGCTIAGYRDGIETGVATQPQSHIALRNNTIYSCTQGIRFAQALDMPLVFINNIVKDCTYNYRTTAWPEEGAAVFGPGIIQRNNCFHGQTAHAYDGTDTKTLAQWNTLSRVDASGDIETDPQLTDPGTGDFSLTNPGSPCLAPAGHGSGVITGYNGVAFNDPPDIGAWSSGVIASTTAPTWTDNLSNITATDATADGEVDLTWDAASQAQSKNIGYIAEYRTTAGPGAWTEAERSNDTSLTVSGLTNDTGYDFRVKAFARVETEPTTTPSDTASATPTGTAAPSQITIAATDQEDGDSIVVAVTGATGVTARVYYRLRGQDDWLGSSEREGNGNVTFTGLHSGSEYAFSGVGVSGGIVSIPSDPAFAWCTSGNAIRAEIRVALGQRLYLDSTLANLISSRVFYVRPPQAIEYPCVTYHISEDNPQMLIDEYGKVDFMIQIDVWSQGDDKMETLDKIVDAIDNLLTDWRVDTTNWLGLRLRRTAGPLRVELKGKQQRAMMWALTAGRKGT